MAYKQNWGLSRRHYQGNTSPMNRMPHIDRLQKQSQTKFAGIDEEILPQSPLSNCGCPSPLNQDYGKVINEAITQKANPAQVSAKLRETFPEVKDNSVEVNWSPGGKEVEVYNMTPDATETESKAVRDKFDATYMKGGKKYNTGDLLDESDFETLGTNYNIQNISEVQSDDKGQFVTTLGDDEITPSLNTWDKNPKFPSEKTIGGMTRDTIRPSIGKHFHFSRK